MKRPSHIDPDFLELSFCVVKEFSGWRVDRFVAYKIPRMSRTRVQRIIKKYAFTSDGKPIKPHKTLKEGETIVIYKQPPDEPDVNRSFEVVYEDDWVVAVNKPPCLPVHPTARYLKNTLTALLQEKYGDNAPVLSHRLDSETSGIVLCSKNPETDRRIKGLFAERQIKKTYLAIVNGTPDPPQDRLEFPLGPDPNSVINVKMCCTEEGGLPSLTEYAVLQSFSDRAYLRLKPRTGRQHQIRVHLAHIGHSIIGDKIYGPDESLFLDYISQGQTDEITERAGHNRHALHAARLELVHPNTDEPLTIDCPLPEDLKQLLR